MSFEINLNYINVPGPTQIHCNYRGVVWYEIMFRNLVIYRRSCFFCTHFLLPAIFWYPTKNAASGYNFLRDPIIRYKVLFLPNFKFLPIY